MKRVVIALLMSSGTLCAQFEGVVESKNVTTDETGAQQHFTMSMWVKDGMARITNSAIGSNPALTMIYRADLKVWWMIDDESKSYFEVSQNEQGGEAGAPDAREEKSVVRKTGKSKTILGYRCTQFVVRQGEAETEIWGTTRLAGLAAALARALGQEQLGPGPTWTDELSKMGIFPLQAYTRVSKSVVEAQEVTRIESRTIGREMFAIPDGYTKKSVEEMLK